MIGFGAMLKSESTRRWVFPDGFSDVSDGLLVLALRGVKLTSLLPAIGTFQIEPNRRADIRDCLVEVSFRNICLCAVMIGRRVSFG